MDTSGTVYKEACFGKVNTTVFSSLSHHSNAHSKCSLCEIKRSSTETNISVETWLHLQIATYLHTRLVSFYLCSVVFYVKSRKHSSSRR